MLVSLLMTLFLPGSIGQPSSFSTPDGSGETVHLFTDRDLYVTAEKVFFSAVCQEPVAVAGAGLSQVLYVELVRWNGSRLAGTKVYISGGKAGGTLAIPGEIESGNYYLRAYTKWMRNYSPYHYSYLQLKIVNPVTMKTETGPEEDAGPGAPIVPAVVDLQEGVQFDGLNEKYGTREKVSLEIGVSGEIPASDFRFGVVRKGTLASPAGSFSFPDPGGIEKGDVLQYYPEIRGFSLSGKVMDEEAGEPVAGARVNLSTVADPLYFSTTLTDASGVFLFTFPDIRGDHEFHISTEGMQDRKTSLLIDNDFCSRPVTLPYRPFFLTADEKGLVRELAVNAQIQSRFDSYPLVSEAPEAQMIPFYGAPTRTIYEKDYIELKNMEEFFYELVYEVNVRRKDGKTFLQMSSFGTLVGYPPLVLMDNIRIDNIDALMNVSCRRVERIEVVSSGYVIGNQFYSGIISLYSEEHDMAGLKLGEDNNFFILSLPETSDAAFSNLLKGGIPDHIPDRRNTLAWQTDLSLSGGDPFSTSFYTPDVPGTYTVYILGVNKEDGSVAIATREIVVEE